MSMKKTVVDWETHLDNRIPITRDDTHRRSIAKTLHVAAERAKADENAVQVNQGRRAGTGMVCGRKAKKGGKRGKKHTSSLQSSYKKKTAELLQQLSGTPRFRKRRRHLRTV